MSESSFSRRKRVGVTPAAAAPKPKAERKTGDKRERILDAAVRVFAKNGFHDTRVADVAKAAGVADGTIYLYFTSKDELLVSLFEDRVGRLLSYVREGLAKHDTARDKLAAIIDLQLGVYDGEPELAEVMTVILRQSTKLLKEYSRPGFMAYLDAIAGTIEEGQRSGEFRADVSPHFVARALFGALDGISLTWALGKADRGGLVRSAKEITKMFLSSLRP